MATADSNSAKKYCLRNFATAIAIGIAHFSLDLACDSFPFPFETCFAGKVEAIGCTL